MPAINFQKTYLLSEAYESIRERAIHVLDKYLGYPGLIAFNDADRSVTFSTERLIPHFTTNRPRVMLLFSNPHPHSIHQGMLLSPNTKGRRNAFWSVMKDAGWLSIPEEDLSPRKLADICIRAAYQGPFELIFYCYYAFPTDFPEDIREIFGREYFREFIEPEASNEFRQTIQDTSVEAVVTFNKGIFNLVSEQQVERYTERLIEGQLIQSQIKSIDRCIPILLTFPTGWRYRRRYMQLRSTSLEAIRIVLSGLLSRRSPPPTQS